MWPLSWALGSDAGPVLLGDTSQSLSFLRVNLMSEQHCTERWTGVAGSDCPRRLAHDAHSGPPRLLTGEKGHEGRGTGTEAGLKPGCHAGRPFFIRAGLVVSGQERQVWGAEDPLGCCSRGNLVQVLGGGREVGLAYLSLAPPWSPHGDTLPGPPRPPVGKAALHAGG